MNKRLILRMLILALSLIFTLVACNKSKNKLTDTPVSGSIVIASDETIKPIIAAEEDVFESMYTLAQLDVKYLSENEIFKLLLNDSVRLVVASRPLNDEEKLYFKNKKFFPKETKIAIDAIAIIINNENPDSFLTVNQVIDIFSGKITSWNKLDKASSLGKIEIVFDNTNSSTIRYFYDSICKNTVPASNVFALNTNKEVIDYVNITKNAIGIIGVSWLSNKADTTMLTFRKQIKVVAISQESKADASNSFRPYQAYIATEEYPFRREVWVINAEPRIGLASGFASFLASDRGQRIILKSGILPTTQPVRIVNINNDFNF